MYKRDKVSKEYLRGKTILPRINSNSLRYIDQIADQYLLNLSNVANILLALYRNTYFQFPKNSIHSPFFGCYGCLAAVAHSRLLPTINTLLIFTKTIVPYILSLHLLTVLLLTLYFPLLGEKLLRSHYETSLNAPRTVTLA